MIQNLRVLLGFISRAQDTLPVVINLFFLFVLEENNFTFFFKKPFLFCTGV